MAASALINIHSAAAQKGNYAEPQIDTMSDAERAVLIQAAKAKAEDLQKQLDDKSAPFDQEYAAHSAEFAVANAPFRLRLQAIEDEKFQGLEDWNKEQLAFIERRKAADTVTA